LSSAEEILVNHNGTILPAGEATVPAMDHGFLYGDSVYETLRTFHGRLFLIEPHLDRLLRSLEQISLALPAPREELRRAVERTVGVFRERHPGCDLSLRLVVTRGIGPIGLDITLCDQPRYLIYAFALPRLPAEYYAQGIRVVVSRVRRNHPSALDPRIKSGNFLNNILAYQDARRTGAHEALLLSADGYVAEGTTSNVFLVRGGGIQTPSAFGILDGITRQVILEEARSAGLPVEEGRIPAERLLECDEAFITSSVRGVVPVTRINDSVVGDGEPGPVTQRVMQIYDARVARECGA
jgi:branched-chain amino acid aminotransferase